MLLQILIHNLPEAIGIKISEELNNKDGHYKNVIFMGHMSTITNENIDISNIPKDNLVGYIFVLDLL